MSQYQLNQLQRVLNAAARVTCHLSRYSHITPALFQLHWLHVASRINFKIALSVYKELKGCSPSYIISSLRVARQCVATTTTSSWPQELGAKHLATVHLPSPDQVLEQSAISHSQFCERRLLQSELENAFIQVII